MDGNNSHSSIEDEFVALTLQLEEVDIGIKASTDGQKPEVPTYPLIAYSKEIKERLQVLQNAQFVRIMVHAVDEDTPEIRAIAQEELRAREDRQQAIQLARSDPCLENVATLDDGDGQWQDMIAFQQQIEDDEELEGEAESLPGAVRHCVSCGDEEKEETAMLRVPCGHPYCHNCLKRLFVLATKDETLWPPRCCQHEIPLDTAANTMTKTQIEAFEQAQLEFATVPVKRVYCCNTDCTAFVPPDWIDKDAAACPRGKEKTCTICRKEVHEGHCPDDPELEETRDLAASNAWTRCSNCQSLVELNLGCFHITCRCEHPFCYLCSVEWKQCACVQFTEHYLLRTAENIIDRQTIPMCHLRPTSASHG